MVLRQRCRDQEVTAYGLSDDRGKRIDPRLSGVKVVDSFYTFTPTPTTRPKGTRTKLVTCTSTDIMPQIQC